VRPLEDQTCRGDDHAAVDDPRHVSAATAFPECRRAEASQDGVGHRPIRGSGAPKVVDSAGVIRVVETGEPAGYSDHGVPGSLVGAGVVKPRGFLQMDWLQCAS
jgi:hypothetical protein